MLVENEKKNLEIVSEEKDVGVITDRNLSFKQHVQNQAKEANNILASIRRNFKFMDEEIFKQLYKALVRPHLEYVHTAWSPYKTSIVDCLEDVQRRATRMLPGMKGKDYEERLRQLNLPSMTYRGLRGDMIEAFKILNNIYDPKVTKSIFKIH